MNGDLVVDETDRDIVLGFMGETSNCCASPAPAAEVASTNAD